MKVKISDLTSIQLCYAVCTTEMPQLVWGSTIGLHWASNQIVVPELKEPDCYSPYTGWDMFGPILEREKITVPFPNTAQLRVYPNDDSKSKLIFVEGSSYLEAAMRCYVASKLGDEIEIPEELCTLL